jgi:hypothetical protein
MKKTAVGCSGCAIFVILLALVVGGAAYWFISPIFKSFQQFEDIGKLNARIENRQPFQAPTDFSLTDRQVQSVVTVQRAMYDELTNRFQAIRERIEEIEKKTGPGGNIGPIEGIQILRSLGEVTGILKEAKLVQVQALNQQRLSLAEYEYIRNTILATMGGGTILNIGDLRGAVLQGEAPVVETPTLTPAQIEANRAVLAPYQEQLSETFGLAFFGL